MSDSFPFEALKAQAIAARSYTLRELRSDRDYDLTDDANDQVFKGFIKENKQAILAVQKTEGVVLTYKDNIARTYYTASNGGQTESSSNAWGSEDTAYLSVREDPYDEENPASVVREFKIPKLWKADSQQAIEFEILLKTAIAQKIALLGYDTDLSYIQIDKIINISASTPKYSDQSRLMTQLSLTLAVSGRRKNSKIQENEVSLFAVETNKQAPSVTPYPQESWGPVEMIDEPIKLTIDIFPQIERILGLSINVKENEIIQVLDEKEAFILRSSRYGHGVGMSQRGAEWMAKEYGKDFSDILSFYYPGTEQKLLVTNPATRPALKLDFLTTPGPIPTATPRPTLVPQSSTPAPDQWQIIITGISQNSSLNLRLLPSLSGEVIGQLYYGQHLLVLERAADEWLHVRADGIEGYVMELFVEKLP